MTKSEMQFAIYTDYYRIGGTEFGFKELLKVWLNRNILAGFRVMYFYRHCIYAREKNKLLFRFWNRCYRNVSEHYCVELPLDVKIGHGFIFYHANGVVMHPNAVIGNNCAILQQVTIGNSGKSRTQVAVLEDGVSVGAGARLVGPIHIGAYSSIGANAVVTHDVPENSTAAGVPARILNTNKPNVPLHTDYMSFEEWKERKNK